MMRRRRRTVLAALTLVVATILLAIVGIVRAGEAPAPLGDARKVGVLSTPAQEPAALPSQAAARPIEPEADRPPITFPVSGSRQYAYAAGRSPVVGRSGLLMRFRVAVEKDITGVAPPEFAAAALATLGAPQGWTTAGKWRFQQVSAADPYDFILYLATPATRDRLCAMGFDQYTSCRQGDRVVINVARWAYGADAFAAPLALYRQYVISHEVGHRLGFGHELCPAKGRPAPVMQQQTLGLHGCTPSATPYRSGRRYAGPSGAYDDAVPSSDR